MGNKQTTSNSFSISYNNPYLKMIEWRFERSTQDSVHLSLNSGRMHSDVSLYLQGNTVKAIDDVCNSLEHRLCKRYGSRAPYDGYLSAKEQMELRLILTYVGAFARNIHLTL